MTAKRILFTGDSITEGRLGCSYMDLLRKQFPESEFVNLGQGGDTVSGIHKRTIKYLQKNKEYDLIVIEAGHNDIILPAFLQKSIIYGSIANKLIKKGSVPAENDINFISIYSMFIHDIQIITKTPIIITTLSTLNENLTSDTNIQRIRYNDGIRNIAAENNLFLAEIAQAFDSVLKSKNTKDYFMTDIMQSALLDPFRSKTTLGADKISRKRSLFLTIDGIHLNSQGADIYSKILTAALHSFM